MIRLELECLPKTSVINGSLGSLLVSTVELLRAADMWEVFRFVLVRVYIAGMKHYDQKARWGGVRNHLGEGKASR